MIRDLRTTMDGRRFRWIEAGAEDAPQTMIWLHAFPLSADMWRPQLEHVPDDWRVIAPDLAGFGGTDDHDGAPSIDDFARDLDELADQLRSGRFVLGGLSMGGYAAFAYLRLNAARVSAVVLADTKTGPDTPQAKEGRQKMLDLVAAKGVAGVADDMLPKLLGATTKENDPGLVAHVRTLIEANAAGGIARATMRLRDRPDARPDLPRHRHPGARPRRRRGRDDAAGRGARDGRGAAARPRCRSSRAPDTSRTSKRPARSTPR